ncbi:MAG: LPXTG cell wall anchor domain-containing protein [Flavisolibacter sp.]
MHLAQVLQMALREKDGANVCELPEKKYVDGMSLKNPHKTRNNLFLLGVALVGIAFFLMKNKRRNIFS